MFKMVNKATFKQRKRELKADGKDVNVLKADADALKLQEEFYTDED